MTERREQAPPTQRDRAIRRLLAAVVFVVVLGSALFAGHFR